LEGPKRQKNELEIWHKEYKGLYRASPLITDSRELDVDARIILKKCIEEIVATITL
jgi:hypothetical protein